MITKGTLKLRNLRPLKGFLVPKRCALSGHPRLRRHRHLRRPERQLRRSLRRVQTVPVRVQPRDAHLPREARQQGADHQPQEAAARLLLAKDDEL